MPPRPRRPLPPAPDPFARLLDRLDATADGRPADDTVPTGFPSVDRALGGGLRRGDLVALGGDVGSGKSALALAMAIRAARAGHAVLYLSGEMGPDRVRERGLAREAKVAVDDLRAARMGDAVRAAVGHAALELRRLPLAVETLPADDFAAVAARLERIPPPALVVVDSLQLLPPPADGLTTDDRLARATAACKALAIGRHVAVLAAVQLPAFSAQRADPRPTLDDLGARGAVKQHADVVLGLYREEMYRRDHAVAGATELILLKNRNGGTGFVDLYFHERWLRFEDLVD
ncbi:MAG: DnaB-like helicase C-terminal domain-containing protein [Gemmatimonadales bacterium]|nr:DnaB-like helicase C-terminal domain-containing protein [Gemmatimonadales bacterium]